MTDVIDEDALRRLYADFAAADLKPLWTVIGNIQPEFPQPDAVPHRWAWADLLPLAERAGDLVPVGRGGERRAIALANPGLGGQPFATPTLWAAIQYLGAGEVAPSHRHAQGAFRFVVRGEAVWTVVNGDPVQMRAGDLLLTPSMHWHGHHHVGDEPMAWLDGLDIPLVKKLDASFFEFGDDGIEDKATPGQVPLGATVGTSGPPSPLGAGKPAEFPLDGLPLGRHRRGAGRPARAGGRGLPGRVRARARGPAVHQPDDRRGRPAYAAERKCTGCAPGPPPAPSAAPARRSGRRSAAAARRSWPASGSSWPKAT